MIFLASIQLSLLVMGLIPKSEGLSLMEVELGAGTGGGGRVTDSDKSDDEGITVEPAINDATDVPLEGQGVATECWVRI